MDIQQIIDKEPAEVTTEDGIHLVFEWDHPFYPQGSKVLMDQVLWCEDDSTSGMAHFPPQPMAEEERVQHATTESGHVVGIRTKDHLAAEDLDMILAEIRAAREAAMSDPDYGQSLIHLVNEVRAAEASLTAARARRDALIRAGVTEHGRTMYAVSKITGLSQPMVKKIVTATGS